MDQTYAYLRRCCDEFVQHREVPDREIHDAVEFAYNANDEHPESGRRVPSWLKLDSSLIRKAIAETTACFDVDSDTSLEASQVLPSLFGENELICTGVDTNKPLIRPLGIALQDAGSSQFIVINPMRSQMGINQRGIPSRRCQNNTSPRRYLVAEFDDPSLSKKDQVAIATFLGKVAPLVLAVDSGGKSIHAWFRVDRFNAKNQVRFFALACLLGADSTRWDPCGWLRMPGGLRCSNGVRNIRQRILFFNSKEGYGA